ncbi:cation diffusion facilitator family transporter [Candidatus Nitrotoga sp. M5]|uniref:cation diffusion facilitator family transporter n=1 Tax=Candidatus Nitrotoga sp. M5 TaxID=2890409 RepID=UPI001EF60B9F|nr:cation diffusion facilitator family transporter [Candidatus Nitrotoga sp. M5]CAH1388185.1 Cation transporter [Candidatus Nitrotoga sp. M5]
MSSASSKKVIYAALVGNTLIAITKFTASVITGSSAMLSEAIHSLVDTGNQVLLLHGLKQAEKPADKDFPFGYGKEIYFWSFVVAILIFALGAGISIYAGIQHILKPELITNPMINYIVLGLALIFEGVAWYMALREFRKSKGKWGYLKAVQRGKDPSIFVVLFEDSAALLGLIIAFLGVFLAQVTGILWFDGLASVIIGLILGSTAVWLAIETKGLLIGESANSEVNQEAQKIAASYPGVEYVNEVLTLHMGPGFILINISINFVDEVSVTEVEQTIAAIDSEIKSKNPLVKRVFIEAESRRAFTKSSSVVD